LVGIKSAMVMAIIGCSIALMLLPQTYGLTMLAVFGLTGVFIAIYNGLLPVYMSDTHPEVGSGALMGLITMIFCISNTIMALLGSWLLHYGSDKLIYAGSGLMFCSALLMLRYYVKHDYYQVKLGNT